MKKHDRDNTDTSRRNFTKAMVTAAVAAPVVASITSCKSNSPQSATTSVRTAGPCRLEVFPSAGGIEEHIPPMEFDGGNGSLLIESRNRLVRMAGGPPYKSVEDPLIAEEHDMLGDLLRVRVITELIDDPYITDVIYGDLADDCELLLWYQKVTAMAGPPPAPSPTGAPGPIDCTYIADAFNRDPDVRVKGGRKAVGRRFTITFKNSRLGPEELTYKCSRSSRYRDTDDGSARGHFRVGQWRIVASDGVSVVRDSSTGRPFEDSINAPASNPHYRPEHFRLYVTYKDYQPET